MANRKKDGGRDRIRSFLEANVGKIVTTHQIAEVAKIRDYPRRIRELRNEEGMQIRTYRDRHDLKPDEYVLESLDRIPAIEGRISPNLRTEILERNGFTCQLCGAGPGDPDPFNPRRKIRLHIDHIVPSSQGGKTERDNLRVTCSPCNEGRSNIQAPTETARNIAARIRRLPRASQREIYEILKRSFSPLEEDSEQH